MAFDLHKNLAISSVLTPPTPATSGGTLVVKAGEGVRFPAAPFNVTIWPPNTLPTPANAEIARCTAQVGDTLTLTRAQEGTTARAIGLGDLIAQTITARSLTDIETQAALLAAANVFTTQQELRYSNPNFTLHDLASPVNMRRWNALVASGRMWLQSVGDAGAFQSNPLSLTPEGDVYAQRYLYERQRPTPLGTATQWFPTILTAEGAVVSGTTVAFYALVGQIVFWSVVLGSFTVPAPTASLQVSLPPLYPQGYMLNHTVIMVFTGAQGWTPGLGVVSGLNLSVNAFPGWTAGNGYIAGQGFYFTTV